jgi:thiosulfate reductase cytochrome b subunit
MSLGRKGIPGPGFVQGGGTAKILRLLPAVVLAVAIAGAVFVVPLVNHSQGGGDWYRGLLGGSGLYRIDVVFARIVPFLIGAATAAALLERGRRQHRAVNTTESLRRHELSEVLTHWLNAVGIGLGLMTAAWLKRWFDRPFSLETTYIIHFVGAGMTLMAVAHHLTYELVGGGGGLLPRKVADFKNALAELASYTGVYRGVRGAFGIQLPVVIRRPVQRLLRKLNIVPDPAGKYLATEKVLSYTVWTVLIGVVVLTGLVKTLNYVIAVPGGVRQPATFLHDGATIFLVVMLGVHVAALVLVPRNWPLLKSMVTTRISRAYARQHLPLWADEEETSERS